MWWKILVGCAICILVIAGALWVFCRLVVDPSTGFDYQLDRKFKSIRQGMKKSEVIRRMGEPREESPEFHLSQYRGFEEEYDRAEKSNSKHYLFWHNGIDITYTIGFDSNDLVMMKASGGT